MVVLLGPGRLKNLNSITSLVPRFDTAPLGCLKALYRLLSGMKLRQELSYTWLDDHNIRLEWDWLHALCRSSLTEGRWNKKM